MYLCLCVRVFFFFFNVSSVKGTMATLFIPNQNLFNVKSVLEHLQANRLSYLGRDQAFKKQFSKKLSH